MEYIRSSSELDKLTLAVLAAQKDLSEVKISMDSEGQRKGYAGLVGIIKAVSPIYLKHGVRIKPGFAQSSEGKTILTLKLIHVSGQWEEDFFSLPDYDVMELLANNKNPHDLIGGGITFFRRYMLKAVLNIEHEKDDTDGSIKDNDKPFVRTSGKIASEAQVRFLKKLIAGDSETEEQILEDNNIESLDQLDSAVISNLINQFKSK